VRSHVTLDDLLLYEIGFYRNENGEIEKMDKQIKKEKKAMDKGMDKLAKMDVKRDKVCDAAMMKKKKK